jgi:ATP-binding cassette subfamily F protein 3
MSLITATNLAKSFGPEDIFSGISLSIPRGARIAIVGPNGIGKTTLLRILLHMEEPSAGKVYQAKNIRIGYLPQEAALTGTHTLWEECLEAVAELRLQEAELANLEAQMGQSNGEEGLLERYGVLQESFERLGGYTYETRIRQTLTGLGFDPDEHHRPLPQLSGGQRTRALLARLLLSNPDLLILDEPTNHLDIQAVEWLESYLKEWSGAALIVSHDRYFLDKVVDHIWEMSRKGMETYRGNYSAYLVQRQERWELRQAVFEAEKERLLKELEYIKRNISGQNVLQAKGRLKRVSRYLDAVEKGGLEAIQGKKWSELSAELEASSGMMSVEEAERRIRGLRDPLVRPPQLHLKLKSGGRSGDLVLRTYHLAVGYADEGRPLFHAPDLTLKRGECAALIGPNGAGKTTFLKTLLERLPPYAGEVALGASLNIGYFAQAHEDLNPGRTLMEEIEAVAPKMLPAEIRDYLAKFLFTGDDVYKKVSTLSGGERGRLALAKLSLTDANLLLLDEPTNHLDIPSQEILQAVLADYAGTILLVSHDRYLIDALATQVWEILAEDASSSSTRGRLDGGQEASQLRVFDGAYSQYKAEREAEKAHLAAVQAAARQSEAVQRARPAPTGEEKRRRARLKEVEEQIASLEVQLKSLSVKLENPPPDPAEVQKLGQEYVRLQGELDQLMEEWEGLHA